jgi:hypothetical protein
MIARIRQWFDDRAERKLHQAFHLDAEKGAVALDIMLRDREWYGGVRVDQQEGCVPHIEVLIVDSFPGSLSTFIPPRIGPIPVLVRFGALPKAL